MVSGAGRRHLRSVMPRLHQRNMLRGNNLRGRATCCAQQATCCGNLLVARSMLLDARNKLLVAGNKLLVARNMLLQATCCAQQARNKQLVARNLLPRNMLRWCKRGFSRQQLTLDCRIKDRKVQSADKQPDSI